MNAGILLVLDGEPRTPALGRLLESLGHRVLGVAGDGRQVRRMCQELAPDLVLMETDPPGLDGIGTARALSLGRPLPVVLVASRATPEFLERARRAGVYSCLVRPVDQAALGTAIELALLNFRRVCQLEDQILGLRRALGERRQVEKAKGLLMERLGLSEPEAGQRLDERARRLGLGLAQAAETVIAEGGAPPRA